MRKTWREMAKEGMQTETGARVRKKNGGGRSGERQMKCLSLHMNPVGGQNSTKWRLNLKPINFNQCDRAKQETIGRHCICQVICLPVSSLPCLLLLFVSLTSLCPWPLSTRRWVLYVHIGSLLNPRLRSQSLFLRTPELNFPLNLN